jgi:hypothetical protein
MKRSTKRVKNPYNIEDVVHTIGGFVGRLSGGFEDNIAIQFQYKDDTGNTAKSKIYTFDPSAARFAGRHLVRLGLKEGMSRLMRMKR